VHATDRKLKTRLARARLCLALRCHGKKLSEKNCEVD
jgi:hypothetical protein